jgi:hypothetical protein
MFFGHTLFAEVVSDEPNPTIVWTPWLPRRGENATWTYVINTITGDARIRVQVFEKDSSDAGNGTIKTGTPSANTSAISSGTYSYRVTNCKELVRLRIVLEDSLEPSGTKAMSCQFRLLMPSWESSGTQGV